MIVKVLPAKPAGSGRALGTYILDLKHETPGERLGAYISDPEKHKVEWDRTVNTGVDEPRWAIHAIELHNAKNLRAHKVSRWEHVVVSFALGEKPTRSQMEAIEDRLMASIGFGDHPRLSAVHKPDGGDVQNWHLHIGVSRIDPTTFKAEHPRHNHFRLQAEAARLELDLGLEQERKTLLARERREIDSRRTLERELDHRIAIDGTIIMFPKEDAMAGSEPLTTIEFSRLEVQELLTRHQLAERLGGAAVTPGVSQSISDKLSTAAGPPPDDEAVKITSMSIPVQLTRQELFSLILTQEFTTHGYPSQRPSYQDRLNEKLTRAEERIALQEVKALEARGFFREAADRLFGRQGTQEQPLARDGKEALERADARIERQGSHKPQERRPSTPRDALYARFQTEKAIAVGARKEAEQAVYDRWSSYHQGLNAHYTVRYEQEKLNPRQPHRVERQQSRELLRAEQIGDRVQAQQMRAQQLAAARKEHPLPAWDKFLERESARGDREAARLLQQERAREKQHKHGHER